MAPICFGSQGIHHQGALYGTNMKITWYYSSPLFSRTRKQ